MKHHADLPYHQARCTHIAFLLPALLISAFFLFGCSQSPVSPRAQNGYIDLSKWDFTQHGNARLDGQWKMYRNKWVFPKDLSGPDPPPACGVIKVPQLLFGEQVQGVYTYMLRLKLAQGHSGLGLKIADVHSAYRLWINKDLATEVGKPGSSQSEEVPRMKLNIVPVKTGTANIDLIMQVSNHFNTRGGIADSIEIGIESDIRTLAGKSTGIAIFVCGSLLMMGIYQILLYLIRIKDRSPLYFGLFCLETGVWYLASSASGRFLTVLLPDLDMSTLYRIDLLSFYLAVPTLMMFLHACFPKERSKLVQRTVLGFAMPCWILVLFAPSHIFLHTANPYMALALVCIVYALVVITKAIHFKREGARYFLAGIIVFGATAVNDVLYANRIIQTAYLFPAGVLALVTCNSFLLALKFFKAFTAVKTLSLDLDEKNLTLQRMDKLKDDFLANTSHELKTPLNGIIGLAESIRDGAFGKLPPSAGRNLGLIADSGRRLSDLINDILDFSRLKNQDLTLDLKPVDIRTPVNNVLAMTTPLAAAKNLALENDIPPDIPCVLADESRLVQIFYNLVGNAIKFTEKGSVRLTAVQTGNMVEIQVIDTGRGITPEDLERIFTPFEQISTPDTGDMGGIGLGLAITRHLATLHNGTVNAVSQPGKGSRFSLMLPVTRQRVKTSHALRVSRTLLAEPSTMPMPEKSTIPAHGTAKCPVHILVVDDDPVNLQVLSSQLAFLDNVDVHTADRGPRAIEFIKTNTCPDLVLLDIMMPGMNGYEVCKALREQYSASILPIVMITAKNRITDLVEGFACGANDYIAKPFSKDELLARVSTQLALKKAYGVLQENIQLKKEVARRKNTEQDLKLMQQRLSRILDAIDDAVIAVNESKEICFSNSPCQKMLGYDPDELLGCPVSQLGAEFGPGHDPMLKKPEDETKSNAKITAKNRQTVNCRISSAILDLDHETLLILVLEKENDTPKLDQAAALSVIRELNINRQRIQILEDTLLAHGLSRDDIARIPALEKICSTLGEMDALINTIPADLEKKRLGHRVMNQALALWQEQTGQNKIEFAEQSGIWKIYINSNGFERTQTLDKYLDINLFPQRPRWRNIFETAEFVLLSCKTGSKSKTELEACYARLKTLH